MLYRCFYCDRTTAFAARITMELPTGRIVCMDCHSYNTAHRVTAS